MEMLQPTKTPLLVQIDGGIGRCICATPALRKLSETYAVTVISPWADVFQFLPFLTRVLHSNTHRLFEDHVQDRDILAPEPYFSGHYNSTSEHLITAFERELFSWTLTSAEIAADPGVPFLAVPQVELKAAASTVSQMRGHVKGKRLHVVAFQPFGATYSAPVDGDPTNRSMSKKLALDLIEGLPECVFVNLSAVNGRLEHARVINFDGNIIQMMAFVAKADFCIGIDSCLAHMAAAFGRMGSFFYGSTSPEKLGYKRFQNIQKKGYPKAFVAMRINSSSQFMNDGAMDYVGEDLEQVLAGIKNHMTMCGLLHAKEKATA